MSDDIEWFTPGTASNIGVVAQNTQFLMGDIAIDDPVNNDLYSGTIIGGQIFCTLYTNANTLLPPEIYVLILENGQAIPNMVTELQRYQAQQWAWLSAHMNFVPGPVQVLTWNFKLNTKRSFKRGNRIVVIGVNRSVAFGAGAVSILNCDLYIYGSP